MFTQNFLSSSTLGQGTLSYESVEPKINLEWRRLLRCSYLIRTSSTSLLKDQASTLEELLSTMVISLTLRTQLLQRTPEYRGQQPSHLLRHAYPHETLSDSSWIPAKGRAQK